MKKEKSFIVFRVMSIIIVLAIIYAGFTLKNLYFDKYPDQQQPEETVEEKDLGDTELAYSLWTIGIVIFFIAVLLYVIFKLAMRRKIF